MSRRSRAASRDVRTAEIEASNQRLVALLFAYPGGARQAAEDAGVAFDKLPVEPTDRLPDPGVADRIARRVARDHEALEELEVMYKDAVRSRLRHIDWLSFRRKMIHIVGTGAVVLGVVAGVAIAVTRHDPPPARPAQGCFPGLVDLACGPSGAPARAFEKDLGLAPVLSDITRGNDAVFDSGAPSVSVAYVVVLPPSSDDRIAVATVRGALEGARDAQRRANGDRRDPAVPLLRLLVVDAGRDDASWQAVPAALERQTRLPNRLVAVIGPTGDPARSATIVRGLRLTGIPVFPSRAPAGLDRYGGVVSTAPVDQIDTALTDPDVGGDPVEVVRDRNLADPLVGPAGEAADAAVRARGLAPPAPGRRDFDGRSAEGTGMFGDVVGDLCARGIRTVYFAGRADDLATFVEAAADRECDLDEPMTVLADDGAVDVVTALLEDPDFGDGETGLRAALDGGRVELHYTTAAAAGRQAPDAVSEGAVAVERAAGCVRRAAAGRPAPPSAYGRDAVTTDVVTRCFLAEVPVGPPPLLAVDGDGSTTGVSR